MKVERSYKGAGMVPSRHPLFREKALKQYMQKQEKDILLRPVSPPVFACSWILLCLFPLAALLAWWQEVPTFVEGSGVILAQGQANTATSDKAVILIFLPAMYACIAADTARDFSWAVSTKSSAARANEHYRVWRCLLSNDSWLLWLEDEYL